MIKTALRNGGGYNFILKCVFLLVCSLLSIFLFSCAGGAGGGSAYGEAASLSIQSPTTIENSGRALSRSSTTQYEKVDSNFETFTVTISSSSYKSTKSCGRGEKLTFSNIPVGHYDVAALAKKADGAVTAKGNASVDVEADVTKTVTIKLTRLNYHTVSFRNTEGGSLAPDQTVSDGYTAVRPSNPTLAGNTFSFWTSDASANESSAPFSFNTEITDDLTLYAVFDVERYIITYNSPAVDVAEEEYTVAAAHTLPTPTEPAGFTFGGWFDNSSFTGDDIPSIPVGTTGNKTYYAKWSIDVAVDSGPEDSLSQIRVLYGDTIDSSDLPTASLTGCTFDGWYKEIDGAFASAAYDFSSPVTDSFTLKAKFNATVTFNSNGGSAVTSQSVVYGGKATAPTAPTKTGVTFGGWYTSNDSGVTLSATAYDFDSAVNSDLTLYAKWVYSGTSVMTLSVDEFLAADFGTTSSESSPYKIKLTDVTDSNISQLKAKIYGNTTSGDMENVYITLDLSECTGLTTIPNRAFKGLDASWNTNSTATEKHRGSLVAITLPNTITSIGEAAFFQSALKTINIPEGVTSIGQSAFNQANLTGELRLPSTLTTLGSGAFRYEHSITKVLAPAGLDLTNAEFDSSTTIERY